MAKEQAEKAKKTKRPTAKKRDIQNEKKRLINKSFTASVRTGMRAFDAAIALKDKTATQAAANTVFSLMDKGVKRKLFKENKAARTKARVASKMSALA